MEGGRASRPRKDRSDPHQGAVKTEARADPAKCNAIRAPACLLRGAAADSGAVAPGTTDAWQCGSMKDLVLVAVTLGFFGASWLYVLACERL